MLETNISLIFWDTIGGIIKNLPWFVLFIYGFKIIAREIKEATKQMPKWINQAFLEMRDFRALDKAIAGRGRF